MTDEVMVVWELGRGLCGNWKKGYVGTGTRVMWELEGELCG